MSERRVTAREILTTIMAEASGRTEAEVARYLDLSGLPGLDRTFPAEEADRMLAGMRRELPEIRAWALDGYLRGEARRDASFIKATNEA